MASAFSSQSNYFFQSNARTRTIVEGAIEIAREIAKSAFEIQSVAKFETWWNTMSFPGIGIELDKLFHTTEEFKFWAQAFQTLAWRIFNRRWGNQSDETWQVDTVSACYLISLMLTGLVWKEDRMWYPEKGDPDGIRPDPMRVRQ